MPCDTCQITDDLIRPFAWIGELVSCFSISNLIGVMMETLTDNGNYVYVNELMKLANSSRKT